jgi:hypothetical protein
MAYGGEGGENVRFKHIKLVFVFKNKYIYIYIYIYVGLIFFHFKDHL